MIYFKKNFFKEKLLFLYRFINLIKILINKIFHLYKFKDKVRVYYGGSLKGNIGGTLVKVKRLNEVFKNNNFKYNLVYLLSNSIYLNKYSLRNLKDSKIPIIHNQNGVFYKGWYGSGWEKKNEDMSFQYQIADYVFYQSNYSRYCAEKFLNNRVGPSEVLYNAVNTDLFYRYKKKIPGKELKILVTGKYQSHLFYSLSFIVKILSELKKSNIQASVNFSGSFSSFVVKELFELSKSLGVEKKIKFTGSYNQEEAPKIYNSADIYFYFVHQSNCPNSVIEAMACGVPVLTTDTGGIPEIVNKNSGICLQTEKSWDKPCVPNLHDALVAVKKIVNNYNEYSDNCINKVEKDHNLNKWIEKHKKIFAKYL